MSIDYSTFVGSSEEFGYVVVCLAHPFKRGEVGPKKPTIVRRASVSVVSSIKKGMKAPNNVTDVRK